MEIKHEVFKRFKTNHFVETGTYAGDGTLAAWETGNYSYITSLEVDELSALRAKLRFYPYIDIMIIHTDSAINLYEYIKDIKEPITFWLDGHWSGEGSPAGLVKMPLLYELGHIKRHPIKTHNIIIDDVRAFKGQSWIRDYDLDDIITKIKSINPNYKIEFADGTEKDDILIAYV